MEKHKWEFNVIQTVHLIVWEVKLEYTDVKVYIVHHFWDQSCWLHEVSSHKFRATHFISVAFQKSAMI